MPLDRPDVRPVLICKLIVGGMDDHLLPRETGFDVAVAVSPSSAARVRPGDADFHVCLFELPEDAIPLFRRRQWHLLGLTIFVLAIQLQREPRLQKYLPEFRIMHFILYDVYERVTDWLAAVPSRDLRGNLVSFSSTHTDPQPSSCLASHRYHPLVVLFFGQDTPLLQPRIANTASCSRFSNYANAILSRPF
jgi:hypothetical protein